jgi:hypothetical protein
MNYQLRVDSMNDKEIEAFRLGYIAGQRSMLISINEGGSGNFIIGDDPSKIFIRSMSERTINRILKSVGL